MFISDQLTSLNEIILELFFHSIHKMSYFQQVQTIRRKNKLKRVTSELIYGATKSTIDNNFNEFMTEIKNKAQKLLEKATIKKMGYIV